MSRIFNRQLLSVSALALAALPLAPAMAQEPVLGELSLLTGTTGGDEAAQTRQLVLPVIRIERESGQSDLQGLYADQTTDINLGLQITPLEGLSLRADAWSIQDQPIPVQSASPSDNLQGRFPQPLLSADSGQNFALPQPFFGSSLESSGFDLGASYVWEAGKAGTFTLETTATYIHALNQRDELVNATAFLNDDARLPGSPELQGSLTLTWEVGNHSASAITNYFDSFKDLSELNLEEINELVENITTVDLQYGYNVKTGKQDRAVVSFSLGIRNIFDKKTTQILNQNSRVVDQNGRVAYGSIKYQF